MLKDYLAYAGIDIFLVYAFVYYFQHDQLQRMWFLLPLLIWGMLSLSAALKRHFQQQDV